MTDPFFFIRDKEYVLKRKDRVDITSTQSFLLYRTSQIS